VEKNLNSKFVNILSSSACFFKKSKFCNFLSSVTLQAHKDL